MKQPLLFLIALIGGIFFTHQTMAQQTEAGQTTAAGQESFASEATLAQPHLVKLNLTALPLRTFSFQYEYALGRRFTAGGGLRIMPKGGVPLLGQFEKLIDDEETFGHLKGVSLSNIALTAEGRYYLGKHGALRGFYVAPYVRFASYKASMEQFEFTVEAEDMVEETRNVPLDGSLRTITGGLLFGAQWKVGDRLYLDWWILGPSIGAANGKFTATAALDEDEQQALRDELTDLDIPMVKTEIHVDNKGARMDMKGPWAGLRAGIGLGFNF